MKSVSINVLRQSLNSMLILMLLTMPQFDIFLNDVLMVFLKTSPAKKRKEKKSTSLSLAKAFVKYHGQTPVSSFTSEGISVATAYAEWIIHHCVYFEVKVVVDVLDQRNLSTGLQSISPLALVDFNRSIPYLSKCYAKRQNEFGVLKMVFRIENASKTFIQYTTTSSL